MALNQLHAVYKKI